MSLRFALLLFALSGCVAETEPTKLAITLVSRAEPNDQSPIIPNQTETAAVAVVGAFLDTCYAEFPQMSELPKAFRKAGFVVSDTYRNDYATEFGDTQLSLTNQRLNISGYFGPSIGSHGEEFFACEIEAHIVNPAVMSREYLRTLLPSQLDVALQPLSGSRKEESVFLAESRRDGRDIRIKIDLPVLTSIRDASGGAVEECAGQIACRRFSSLTMRMELN